MFIRYATADEVQTAINRPERGKRAWPDFSMMLSVGQAVVFKDAAEAAKGIPQLKTVAMRLGWQVLAIDGKTWVRLK